MKQLVAFLETHYPAQRRRRYSVPEVMSDIITAVVSGHGWRSVKPIAYKRWRQWCTCGAFRDFYRSLLKRYMQHMLIQDPRAFKHLYTDTTKIVSKQAREVVGPNMDGGGKHYCSKLAAIVDTNGVVLSALLCAGDFEHDCTTVRKLVDELHDEIRVDKRTTCFIMGDKAYQCGAETLQYLESKGFRMSVPKRRNSKSGPTTSADKKRLRKRFLIEHAFNRIKSYKRLTNRYEHTESSFMSLVYLVCTLKLIKYIPTRCTV